MNRLYEDYFQKSKVFLFPLLGISRKSSIQVTETYITWNDEYKDVPQKLICVYEDVSSEAFQAFAAKVLLSNPLYLGHRRCIDDRGIYIFDMNIIKNDWDHFISGSYSRMSKTLKDSVLKYYGTKSTEYEYVKSFLYPEDFFDVYAQLLDVDENILRKVGELCDKYNPELENLNISVELLESSAEFI